MTMPISPPHAQAIPCTHVCHGEAVVDDYAWLRNKEDPAVLAYLEAENEYACRKLERVRPLQEKLFIEMLGRVQLEDSSVPERRGSYLYYWQTTEDRPYRTFYRRHFSHDAPEELLLDENVLAEGHAYYRIETIEPSPDGALLAFTVDTTGEQTFTLHVKDLGSGILLPCEVAAVGYSLVWAEDNRSLLFSIFDEAHRAFEIRRLVIGRECHAQPEIVYTEHDDAFHVHVSKTSSRAFLLISSSSMDTSEVRFAPAGSLEVGFELIQARQQGIEYQVGHHGDHFLILTNRDARNFKGLEVPISRAQRAHERELIPHRDDVLIEGMAIFRDHLVFYERRDGLKRIRISAPDGISDVRHVQVEESAYSLEPCHAQEFDSPFLRFTYSSLVTPETVVDYDLATGEWIVRKKQAIPSGYDPSRYRTERLEATAPDGTRVPISLVYLRSLQLDGSNPLVLYGYGSYGYSVDPAFDPTRLSLLERGFVYAIAHVRGGSELGREWYEQGRLMYKKNTFNDFIACAEHLISQGYTSPERLVAMGASAGGVLVAAAINMRPELFKAAVVLSPFTDVTGALLDSSLPLTVIDHEEWGNPEVKEAFDYMRSYSPCDNIAATTYPHIFVKAGIHDIHVPYWHQAKWVAKLRACKTDSNFLLLVTDMTAGHEGASDPYAPIREQAEYQAFLLDVMSIDEHPIESRSLRAGNHAL